MGVVLAGRVGMLLRSVIALLGLAAACRSYQPGTLSVGGPDGELRRVGCLDIAVSPGFDVQAQGPVAHLTFANRCDAAVEVDLASIVAQGRRSDGGLVRMRVFDPKRVIRPALLEARRIGRETLEFHASEGATEYPGELCLDLSRVDRDTAYKGPVIACIGGGVGGAGGAGALAEVQP